ncbi:hypothetical protein [Streptomyces spiramyceticus]|uniref:hypothetical protein n=1 Tax=Streptomyces spiramyceticus TaxID=299717 RepID=UPI00237BD3AB|nr:hypothetical protein [Streptomyces spiramyceticus]
MENVQYVDSEGAAYVQGDHGTCTIAGEHAYVWLSRLAPLLTGEHTLEELTCSLSLERQALVRGLVTALAKHRFVVDVGAEQPHGLSPVELETYAPEIAFIRYGFDSAEWRFERVREARIVLVGSGPVLASLLRVGLTSGWRSVRLIDAGGVPTDLAACLAAARRDEGQKVISGSLGDLDQAQIWDETDVVLQVHDGERDDVLLDLAARCARHRTALGQGWVRRDEAWLSRVSAWNAVSYWRRLAGLAHQASGAGEWLSGAVPEVLAAQMALSCFEHLTGMAPELRRPELARVDLRTLDTRSHLVQSCLWAAVPDASLPDVAACEPVAAEDLLERVAEYVDARTGVLGLLDEQDLVQMPWAVCRAIVSDPRGVLPAGSPAVSVIGWGSDRSSARLRTVLAALSGYQALAAVGAASAPYVAPVGVAAGLSWPQAVAAGLAQQCEAVLRQVSLAEFPTVAPLADAQVAHLVALLETAGERVRIHDLCGVLEVPAYAVAGAAPACASTAPAAMRFALERALLAWQSRTERQPDYADVPVRWVGDDCPDPQSAEAFADRMTAALTRAGRTPRVRPLVSDSEVARLLPFTVHVAVDGG